jgi:hypothetical protein
MLRARAPATCARIRQISGGAAPLTDDDSGGSQRRRNGRPMGTILFQAGKPSLHARRKAAAHCMIPALAVSSGGWLATFPGASRFRRAGPATGIESLSPVRMACT